MPLPFIKRHAVVLLPLWILSGWLASFSMWRDAQGNTVTALHTGWGDLLFHIRAGIFFMEQGGWPTESFFLSGQPVGYAFASDWLAGALWSVGMPIAHAFALPTIILAITCITLLYWIAWRFTSSLSTAVISVLLFMGFGGVSGWYVLPEIASSPTIPWWQLLRDLPHEVTAWHSTNMVILNPFVMMLHQRAYLLGFPLFLILLYLSWQWLYQQSKPHLIAMTIGGTVLALIHPFTWAVYVMLVPTWYLCTWLLKITPFNRRSFFLTLSSFILIASFGFAIVHSLQPSAGSSTISWHPGWLEPTIAWPLFWLKNLGVYVVLIALALPYLWKNNRNLLALLLSTIAPFIAGNLFRFSPWEWDNTKIFAPLWFIVAIVSAYVLASWWKQSKVSKCAVIITILLATFSGNMEIMRILTYGSMPMVINTSADEALGKALRAATKPDEVMLTAPTANHPVFMFSGRPSFVAYEGWLWSQGWQGIYNPRMADMQTIYQGGETADQLLQKNNISLVVIGSPEQAMGANQAWFDQHYPVILDMNGYKVYRVKAL